MPRKIVDIYSISVSLSLNNARLFDFGQVLLLCNDLAFVVSADATV
jgi:hypothetical protein